MHRCLLSFCFTVAAFLFILCQNFELLNGNNNILFVASFVFPKVHINNSINSLNYFNNKKKWDEKNQPTNESQTDFCRIVVCGFFALVKNNCIHDEIYKFGLKVFPNTNH